MESPEPDRRTLILGATSLATGSFFAGCLGGSDEPAPNGTTDSADDEEPTEPDESTDTNESTDTDGDDRESTESIDGLTFGSDDASCGIVFVPQINMDRTSWTDQAKALAGGERFGLAIDPEDDRPTAIRNAIDSLRSTVGVDHVVLVGASIGAEAAVVAAAEASDDVDGLVALSPGGGTGRASELRARSLFVVAENDDDRFVETTQILHENAPDPTRLEVLPGGAHGQRLFDTDRGDALQNWIDELIETVCTANDG
ncbi:alpha/beta fold hydrolase [Natrinema halophilum]|uniref:alpha/beta fold hydrolase n=1 Tax=Natrinema halophilum TaxID=1699371 RepID=UPI001F2B75C1|nr:hypothetical protein [Natrinema halophilum]UHQ96145.1 hypothetical protein HYG82_22755 [Natrinema halophilum]